MSTGSTAVTVIGLGTTTGPPPETPVMRTARSQSLNTVAGVCTLTYQRFSGAPRLGPGGATSWYGSMTRLAPLRTVSQPVTAIWSTGSQQLSETIAPITVSR